MIVIFDPHPPFIHWYTITGNDVRENTCEFTNGWKQEVSDDLQAADGIAYVLHNGGDEIRNSRMAMTPDLMPAIEKCIKLLPEHNQMTLDIIRHGMQTVTDAAHSLLCETALFIDLPSKARHYALPPDLREKGVKRYGGHGLTHTLICEQARKASQGSFHTLVSIMIGPETNIAAFDDWKPVETSIGFTTAEGIPSLHGCGDTDASFVFLLEDAGMNMGDIKTVFSKQDGLCALSGNGGCSLPDILQAGNDSMAYQVLRYYVLRNIGSAMAYMGGADAFYIHGEYTGAEMLTSMKDICRPFEFMGLRYLEKPDDENNPMRISAPDSAITVVYSRHTRASPLKYCMVSD